MDQSNQRTPPGITATATSATSNARSSSSPSQHQLHPARAVFTKLFDLYLGRSSRPKLDENAREPPNKLQKRVTAPNKDLPPRNEQFLLDFERLQAQFQQEQDQARAVLESVLVSFIVQCSGHAPQAEFMLYAVRILSSIGYINWDTFLPSVLSTVSTLEASGGQSSQLVSGLSGANLVVTGLMPSPSTGIPNAMNLHASNLTPLPSISGMGSPSHSAYEQPDGCSFSPVKTSDISGSAQQHVSQSNRSDRGNYLRQLSCKIILVGLDFNLKPVTHADVFSHMLSWLVDWDHRPIFDEHDNTKERKPEGPSHEWLHICLDVIWMLVDKDRCHIPFYELLRSGLQFLGNTPDDEALFPLILEIHRRRDMVAMHMQMLDQHLHCPSFGTHRALSHTHPSTSGEPGANIRYSPITYPSVLGEPLTGEVLATSIQKGSLDWERALRCLRHALRTAPSPEWWRRVLIVLPCYRTQAQQLSSPGAVFSNEMVCEAVIDRTVELLHWTYTETDCWHDWLVFSDMFFFFMKSGCIDCVDFLNKLSARISSDDQQILRGNHVTWLLAQIIRLEVVTNCLTSDPRKVETGRMMISFHKEDKTSDTNNVSPQSVLLDFISSSQTLRIWSFNNDKKEYLGTDELQKGKQMEEWWKQVTRGERVLDFSNLDDRSMGMFWVISFTMAQHSCDALVNWLSSVPTEPLQVPNMQPTESMMVMREIGPLSVTLLSGLSLNTCSKLCLQLEEAIFLGPVIPSIAMVETYVRLLLIAPNSLFRPHFSSLTQKCPTILNKSGVTLLLLEILNYRLFSLYRYHGKNKALMYDVTKIIAMIKGKRGEHRMLRLAENLCMNLILSIRDFFMVKKDLKGPTEFTETLNRITIISLAITIKTRGIAEVEHMIYLQPVLEQLMLTCQHTWSEKTMRHFPPLIRDFLQTRPDRRAQAIQAWQQAEATVINQCTQLLSPTADPSYVATYIGHSFPQHRQYFCSGVWILMGGHPENINIANLGRVLREFSPEEVTSNIYMMVDVLLNHIQVEVQHGHLIQDLIQKANSSLAFLIWQHELLPLDIVLLALIDRDDDPCALPIVLKMLERQELLQRVKFFCSSRGSPDHWLNSGIPKRVDLQKSLGHYLSWKDRSPTFFDDIAARLLPVIPLIIYRLVENDAYDPADRVLVVYSSFLAYHPLKFTFVRDILAYFYGHLPSKFIKRILNVLDLSKIPLSETFPQQISLSPAIRLPIEYFVTLLLNLVSNVIPPLSGKCNRSVGGDASSSFSCAAYVKSQTVPQSGSISSDGQRVFYQYQDPGTYTQLVLETAVIEILSLPIPASQIVASLVQMIVHIQPTLIQNTNGLLVMSGAGQSSGLPTSPSGGSTDSLGTTRSNMSTQGINASSFMSKTGYSCQQLSSLMIQACGLLLAQLPLEFHLQLYSEAARVIKECWWLTDGKRSSRELESSVGYALLDPAWAAQENTSTAVGNIVALLHSFFSNLPQEWLESTQAVIKHLRPVTSVATLRIAFRIMGPLIPRLSFVRPVFFKIVALLFNCLGDVFGRNTQTSSSVEASEVADLLDFLHHIVLYDGQGGPVQSSSKPKVDTLTLCGKAIDMLRPDVQHILSHLQIDPNSSVYAATHPKLSRHPT